MHGHLNVKKKINQLQLVINVFVKYLVRKLISSPVF